MLPDTLHLQTYKEISGASSVADRLIGSLYQNHHRNNYQNPRYLFNGEAYDAMHNAPPLQYTEYYNGQPTPMQNIVNKVNQYQSLQGVLYLPPQANQ